MTDPVAIAALGALDQVISGIALPPPPPSLSHRLRVVPSAVRHRGLGGYAGEHPEPRGAVLARRVRAVLDVRVDGGAEQAAADHLQSVIRALLTQSAADLRGRGIERLALNDQAPPDPRGVQFELSFEYLHRPTSSEGRIDSLDLAFDLNRTPYRARYRFDLATRTLAGAPQPLSRFMAIDDAALNAGSPPGEWLFDVAGQCIVQNAATQGGPLDLSDPRKAGTQLLWRVGGAPLASSRFIASIEFDAISPDGVGIVFGRSGTARWHFLASQRHGYHQFGRFDGNAGWHTLGAVAAGFATGVRHTLTVTAFDHTVRASLDGAQTLDVHTELPVPAGELGFFTQGNAGARFHRVRLIELY